MKYIIAYVLIGLIIGLVDHRLRGYMIELGEEVPNHGEIKLSQALFWMIAGVIRLPWLIYYLHWMMQVIKRRRDSREMLSYIQAMGLDKFDPIMITFINGESHKAIFNRIDEKRMCLIWLSQIARIGGYDRNITSYLTMIKKIERAEHRPGVIW